MEKTNNIVFVTGNKGKLESAKKYFKDFNVTFSCCDLSTPEPEVNDIEYISKVKVKAAYEKLGVPCIALDAGFYIPAYPNKPNFPGAFVKRELMDTMGVDGLLEQMQGVSDRSCYFKECLCYYDGREFKYFYGCAPGSLSTSKQGCDSDKKWSELWYVFIPSGYTTTFAQMTDKQIENRKGEHSVALKEFAKWYKEKNSGR